VRARQAGLALARQLGLTAATIIGLLAITFFIGRIIPTDPVLAAVGDRASAETYANVRHQMGLDRPLYVQFGAYVADVVTGQFGVSILSSRPVLEDIKRVFTATFELATISVLLAALIGIPLGVLAAARRGTLVDHIARLVNLFGHAMPVFWLAMMALLLFYGRLGWSPGPGRLDALEAALYVPRTGFLLLDPLLTGDWDLERDAMAHLLLPAAVLAFHGMAYITRMTRSLMIGQLSQEYVVTARAKGCPYWMVIRRHAFRNIRGPLLTVVALTYAGLLEGTVLTETVFSWPGLGRYLTNALFAADMNATLAATIVIGIVFIILNRLSDAAAYLFDPRARA
jgi:peptide/nickel transport system permease protein